jgi:hypothetical protein
MAWEGAKLSLMAPNRPERRSESVTDNPAKNGADSMRVHSSGENFLERSALFSLILRDGTPILPKQNLKVRLETGMRQTYLELDATLDPNFCLCMKNTAVTLKTDFVVFQSWMHLLTVGER